MGGIVDSLFSVIPIVLIILWLLRRTTKNSEKRRRTTTPARDNKGPSVPILRDRIEEKIRHEPAKRAERKFGSFAAKTIESFLGESVTKSKSETSRGNKVLNNKMEDRKIDDLKNVKISKAVEAGTHRTVADIPGLYDVSMYNQRHQTILERISRLSPPAQGMIWSFILDEPPGMKEL